MFWRAFLQAITHSLVTLITTIFVWAIWLAWTVLINGFDDMQWSGQWGTFRFGMIITFIISLIVCGGFLVLSLIYHYFVKNIPREREILSSLSLAVSSLILLLVLPEGGFPLIVLLIGLPILATLWMFRSTGRVQET